MMADSAHQDENTNPKETAVKLSVEKLKEKKNKKGEKKVKKKNQTNSLGTLKHSTSL